MPRYGGGGFGRFGYRGLGGGYGRGPGGECICPNCGYQETHQWYHPDWGTLLLSAAESRWQ